MKRTTGVLTWFFVFSTVSMAVDPLSGQGFIPRCLDSDGRPLLSFGACETAPLPNLEAPSTPIDRRSAEQHGPTPFNRIGVYTFASAAESGLQTQGVAGAGATLSEAIEEMERKNTLWMEKQQELQELTQVIQELTNEKVREKMQSKLDGLNQELHQLDMERKEAIRLVQQRRQEGDQQRARRQQAISREALGQQEADSALKQGEKQNRSACPRTADLETVAKALSLKVVTGSQEKKLECKPLAMDKYPELVQQLKDLVAEELTLYSKDFMNKAKLNYLVLCEQLQAIYPEGSAITAGLASPYGKYNAIYLNIRFMKNRSFMREVIQHELFHIVDSEEKTVSGKHALWAQMNEKADSFAANIRYDAKESVRATVQKDKKESWRDQNKVRSKAVDYDQDKGFVSRYASSSVAEDKAEVFSMLMTDPSAINKKQQADPYIGRKVALMKNILREFSPEMDDAFWTTLQLKRNQIRQCDGRREG